MSDDRQRARLAALRIAAFLEEFSPAEIAAAIEMLDRSDGTPLPGFLAKRSVAGQDLPRALERGTMTRRRQPRESVSNPILRGIETELRLGNILPEMDDIRAFGGSISKDFEAGTSRRDAIPRLIELLASLEEGQLRDALSRMPAKRQSPDQGYQRLAEHLIDRS